MKKQIISLSVLVLGFVLGATALSAFADWTPPNSAPTTCETNPLNPGYHEGCNAPINIGLGDQTKSGILRLVDLVVAKINTNTVGDTPVAGDVLTAVDATGTVEWRASGAGGGFDFVDSSTVYTATVTGATDTVNVGPAEAKGAALSFIKPDATPCSDFTFNVFKAGAVPNLVGRVWSAAAGADTRNAVGGFMVVPTVNGNIMLQKYSGDGASCDVIIIKIADIY